MNFAQALILLMAGGLLARQAWGPTATANCLVIAPTDANGNTTSYPLIYTATQNSIAGRTLYIPTQADILACDWYSVC